MTAAPKPIGEGAPETAGTGAVAAQREDKGEREEGDGPLWRTSGASDGHPSQHSTIRIRHIVAELFADATVSSVRRTQTCGPGGLKLRPADVSPVRAEETSEKDMRA